MGLRSLTGTPARQLETPLSQAAPFSASSLAMTGAKSVRFQEGANSALFSTAGMGERDDSAMLTPTASLTRRFRAEATLATPGSIAEGAARTPASAYRTPGGGRSGSFLPSGGSSGRGTSGGSVRDMHGLESPTIRTQSGPVSIFRQGPQRRKNWCSSLCGYLFQA